MGLCMLINSLYRSVLFIVIYTNTVEGTCSYALSQSSYSFCMHTSNTSPYCLFVHLDEGLQQGLFHSDIL